jgi:hypothetical protein
MTWVTGELDLNSSGVEYLSFSPKDHNIRAIFKDPVTKVCSLVTREVFVAIVSSAKTQASDKTTSYFWFTLFHLISFV